MPPVSAQQTSPPRGGRPGQLAPSFGPGGLRPSPSVRTPAQQPPTAPAAPNPSQVLIPEAFQAPTLASESLYEFHPTLTLSEEYTDNFFFTPTNRTENFRTRLGLGFLLRANTPKTQGYVSTDVGFVFDTATETDRLSLFPSILLSATHAFSPRLSLTITDNFARDDENLGDSFATSSTARVSSEIRGQERRKFIRNSFSATVDWLIDVYSTQAYYRNSLFFSEDDSDTVGHVLGAMVSRPIGALTTVSAGYQLGVDTSSNRDGAAGGNDRTSVGHTMSGSVSRQVGTYATAGVSSSYTLQSRQDSSTWNVSALGTYGLPTGPSVSGRVGYSRLSGARTSQSAVSMDITAAYQFAGGANVSVGFFQDFSQTFLEGEDFGVTLSRSYYASTSFPVTPATTASVRLSYTEEEPTGVGNDPSRPDTHRIRVDAALATPLFTLGLDASRSEDQVVRSGRGAEVQDEFADTWAAGASLSFQPFRPLGWLTVNMSYRYLLREPSRGSAGEPATVENRGGVRLIFSF